jgi:DNA topoisomerase-2
MSEQYDVMDHKEHVLKKPSTYIGSVEQNTYETWLFDNDTFVKKEVKFSKGFENVLNETLTNASDQVFRTREHLKKDESVIITKNIKLNIYDDGKI